MVEGTSKRSALTPARVLWVVLALVAVILIAQNSNDTQIEVFGWTIQAPLFLVILASMLIGWALGTLGVQAWSLHRRHLGDKRTAQNKSDKGSKDAKE
jgi:uncharacterized integral membrane protein